MPVTIRVSGPDPAIALEGAIAATVGAGNDGAAVTEKLAELETAEPFDTVIAAVACTTVSVYGIRAVSSVALTNVVDREDPFQFTADPFTKFVPFTCNVNPVAVGLQLGVEVAVNPETLTEVMVGVGGGVIVNETAWDVPPPGPGVNKVMLAVPVV